MCIPVYVISVIRNSAQKTRCKVVGPAGGLADLLKFLRSGVDKDETGAIY